MAAPPTWLSFATVVAAWGSSYLFIRLAIASFTPLGLVGTRFTLAALVCLLLGRLRGERWPPARALVGFAAVGLMMMSGSNALTAWAQRTVPSGVTGVVHALGSVWLAALAALGLWGGERPAPRAWLGIAGGVLGVAVLAWPVDASLDSPWGFAALVVATWIFAAASRLQRWAQQQGSTALFLPLAVQCAAGGLTGLAASLGTGGGLLHAPLTPAALGAVGFLTLVSSVAGFAAYAVVLRDWPAARVGSFAVLNPVVSIALGALVLHEPVTPRTLVGAGLTLASVALVQRSARRP